MSEPENLFNLPEMKFLQELFRNIEWILQMALRKRQDARKERDEARAELERLRLLLCTCTHDVVCEHHGGGDE